MQKCIDFYEKLLKSSLVNTTDNDVTVGSSRRALSKRKDLSRARKAPSPRVQDLVIFAFFPKAILSYDEFELLRVTAGNFGQLLVN